MYIRLTYQITKAVAVCTEPCIHASRHVRDVTREDRGGAVPTLAR